MNIRRIVFLAILVGSSLACQTDGTPGLQGVVLVVLDTARADHLGCYGYERPTSPRLDALAGEGVRFEQVVAPAPWTLPSMAALLAGQYPERVIGQEGLVSSVVEELQSAGIRTVAFTEGGFVSDFFGFDRGFDEWTEEEGAVQLLQPGQQRDPDKRGGIERTFARAEQWLADHAADRFFLLVHTYEPHTPYTNREFTEGLQPGRIGPAFTLDDLGAVQSGQLALTPTELEYLIALYDGDIFNSDRHVGALLEKLDELDLADRVAVIVTSDHGEELGEHFPSNTGDHGHSLRDTEVMVPLIIRDPGEGHSGKTVGQQIRLLDVMPTVADLLGVELPGSLDGRSLRSVMTGDESRERLALLSQTKDGPKRVGLRAMGHKYIRTVQGAGQVKPLNPTPPLQQLYDLSADPGERDNLVPRRPEMVRLLDQMLAERWLGYDVTISPELANEADPALLERLRSLGYLR